MTRFITRRLTAGSSRPFYHNSMGPVSTEWLTLYEQYLIQVRSLLQARASNRHRLTYHTIYITKNRPTIVKLDSYENKAWLKVTVSLKGTKIYTDVREECFSKTSISFKTKGEELLLLDFFNWSEKNCLWRYFSKGYFLYLKAILTYRQNLRVPRSRRLVVQFSLIADSDSSQLYNTLLQCLLYIVDKRLQTAHHSVAVRELDREQRAGVAKLSQSSRHLEWSAASSWLDSLATSVHSTLLYTYSLNGTDWQ